MRKQLIVLGILLHFAAPVPAQISFGFGFQSDNVSISLSTYPNLVRVPGYPVYYASGLNSNYFFYDGLYWVFESDRWYSSSWYNGPWTLIDPEFIPVYLLRVPVRYYRQPPAFFVGWQANSPPRWGDHWGNDWERQRSGWNRPNHQSMPAPAPLPTYQRQYSGDRYPSRDQQPILQQRNYRHEARDPMVRQQSNAAPPMRSQPDPAQPKREDAPQRRNAEPSTAPPRPAPAMQAPMPSGTRLQDSPRARDKPEPQQQAQPAPRTQAEPNQQRGQPTNEAKPGTRLQDSPRARDKPEPQQQAQPAPRAQEHTPPRAMPEPQREQNPRPQAEANPQRGQPANEAKPAPRQQEPGQRSGQQPERDNSDERGQGRGR
jgi:hypothetical protein